MYAIIRRNTSKKGSSATAPATEGETVNIKETSNIMTWGRQQQQKPGNISSTAVGNTTQRSRTPGAGRRQQQQVCLGNGREASNSSENDSSDAHNSNDASKSSDARSSRDASENLFCCSWYNLNLIPLIFSIKES
jgi:hypothetical protein